MIKNTVLFLCLFLISLIAVRGCLIVNDYEQEEHNKYVQLIK